MSFFLIKNESKKSIFVSEKKESQNLANENCWLYAIVYCMYIYFNVLQYLQYNLRLISLT